MSALALEALLAVVRDPRSVDDLQEYFLGVGGRPECTGAWFERLGGGGDRFDVADCITAQDLLAVTMLSVRLPAPAVIQLLETPLRDQMSTFLRCLPCDVAVDQQEAGPLLEEGGPVDGAWGELQQLHGVGWVIGGKLLARKRPALIPVYDSVVRCALGWPPRLWMALHDTFGQQDKALGAALGAAQDRAAVEARVSPLRVLDVVVWMRHRKVHRDDGCRGLLAR